jgi:hypothetical protein
VLLNPANVPPAETTLRQVQEAARTIGLQIHVLNASTSRELDAAFATLAHERPDALFVAPDAFFIGRRVQIATLAARERIPAAYVGSEFVEVGGLISYGTDPRTVYIKLASIPAKSSTAPSPQTCLSCRRPSSLSQSTSRPPRPSEMAPAKGLDSRRDFASCAVNWPSCCM